jgi:hypothetical protein
MSTKSKTPKTPKTLHNQVLVNLMNEKKFDELATYVSELVQGMQRAGQAINRLERFQFSLIKILLGTGMKYEELQAAMDLLDRSDDIEVFWGVKAPSSVDEPAQAGEV